MNSLCFPWAGRIVVIAPECMGMRSLAAMAFLALFLSLWVRPGLWKSLVLFVSGACLAILGNVTRIGLLMLVMACTPNEQFFQSIHDVAGYAVMLVEALILGSICDRLAKKTSQTKEQ